MKKSFTLAEVLIILTIIGVISSLTVPNFMIKYQKAQFEAAAKANYQLFANVIKQISVETSLADLQIDNTSAGVKEFFDTYLAHRIKYTKVCEESAGCWHSGENLMLNGKKSNWDNGEIGFGRGIVTFKMQNGVNVLLDVYIDLSYISSAPNENGSLVVVFDVNGNKKPNIVGKDIFVAVMTEKGLMPAGWYNPEKVDANCSKTSNDDNAGYFCLYKMMTNGWRYPDRILD